MPDQLPDEGQTTAPDSDAAVSASRLPEAKVRRQRVYRPRSWTRFAVAALVTAAVVIALVTVISGLW